MPAQHSVVRSRAMGLRTGLTVTAYFDFSAFLTLTGEPASGCANSNPLMPRTCSPSLVTRRVQRQQLRADAGLGGGRRADRRTAGRDGWPGPQPFTGLSHFMAHSSVLGPMGLVGWEKYDSGAEIGYDLRRDHWGRRAGHRNRRPGLNSSRFGSARAGPSLHRGPDHCRQRSSGQGCCSDRVSSWRESAGRTPVEGLEMNTLHDGAIYGSL